MFAPVNKMPYNWCRGAVCCRGPACDDWWGSESNDQRTREPAKSWCKEWSKVGCPWPWMIIHCTFINCFQISCLTTSQRVTFLSTRKHGLFGKELRILKLLVKFFLTYYLKMYLKSSIWLWTLPTISWPVCGSGRLSQARSGMPSPFTWGQGPCSPTLSAFSSPCSPALAPDPKQAGTIVWDQSKPQKMNL